MILKKTEVYLKSVIEGRKQGLIPTLLRACLLPISWVYQNFSKIRNWLYDRKWMRCYIPPIPLVISVGNIVAGGTGKTPVVLMLSSLFYEKHPLAILSRGYRSKVEHLEQPTVVCAGQGPLFPASYVGDESQIYALRYPKSLVIVGKNRKKASQIAFQAGAEVIILDDALQHRKIARDVEIIVIDCNDPFGQNYFLPRGYLREDASALKRANCVILNHVKNLEHFKDIEAKIKPLTSACIVGTRYEFLSFKEMSGTIIESLKGKTVGLFSSIAHPNYFREMLEEEGIQVAADYLLADHDEVKEKQLALFCQSAMKQECEWLICTEKDRVKLRDDLNLNLPIAWAQIGIKIISDTQDWQKFTLQLLSKLSPSLHS